MSAGLERYGNQKSGSFPGEYSSPHKTGGDKNLEQLEYEFEQMRLILEKAKGN